MHDHTKPQPTRTRALIVAVATLMAVVLYLQRTCISIAELSIKNDVGLNDTQMGLFMSTFFWAYALGQVPAGWLGDRFGVRPMLSAMILLWSLFSGLMGLAQGLALLVIFRLGAGLAQAGAYPASASLLSKWMPFRERGLGSAIVSMGGRVGGAVAPLLTAVLLLQLGWRLTLTLYSLVGILVAGLFWVCFRERPRLHPWTNQAEIDLIETGQNDSSSSRSLPIGAMLRNRSLWLISLSQFTTNFGWVFLVSWMPRYLTEVFDVQDLERGKMTSLPLLLAIPASIGGGWLTDRLTRKVGLRWGRALPLGITRFVAMAAFLLCPLCSTPWGAALTLAAVAVATDLGTPSVWAYKQDVGGAYVGSILGWGNMWGNLGAALSAQVLPGLKNSLGWNAALIACAAAFFLSGLVSLGVDARARIAPPEEPAIP